MSLIRATNAALLTLVLSMAACSAGPGGPVAGVEGDRFGRNHAYDRELEPYAVPNRVALAWETADHRERSLWSTYAYRVIHHYLSDLDRASDMGIFCADYAKLPENERVMAWGQLFVGISYYESSWSPVDRMEEVGLGVDPITGKQVWSEGLLQLSYQDMIWNTYCPFDWETDKALAGDDPRKTIFDPYRNLYCGIRIMADIVHEHGVILPKEGGYWSTLGPSNTENGQRDGIVEIVRTLPFCR